MDRWFACGVLAAGVALVVAGANGWFMFDDWMLLGSRRDVLADDGVAAYLFRSHNDHLMAGVVVWQHVTVALFGLDSYLPITLWVAAAHMVIAVAVRALLLRLGVRRALASVVALLLMLWGPATGALVWGLDATFAFALGLFLIQLLLAWHADGADRRDVVGAVVGLVAVASHSTGLLGVVVIVGFLAGTRRWKPAAIAATPLLPYALWFVTYRRQPSLYLHIPGDVDYWHLTPSLSTQFDFARSMLSTPLSALLPGAVGLALLIVAVGVVLRADARRGDRRRPVLLALLAFLGLFVASTARTRSIAGVQYATEFRYVYVTTLLALPFFALALQHLADSLAVRWNRFAGAVCLVVVVAAVGIANVDSFVVERRQYQAYMRVSRAEILALAAQPDLDALPATARVSAVSWDLNVDHVRRLVAQGLLPTRTRVQPELIAAQRERLLEQSSGHAEPEAARTADTEPASVEATVADPDRSG